VYNVAIRKGATTLMEKFKSEKNKIVYSFFLACFLIIVTTMIGYLFRGLGFPETNIVIVYLLGIQILVWLSESIISGIIASIMATLAFNYFFTAPYLTFSVHDSSYIITFIIMTLTSVITSTLTSIAKKNALIAQEKEVETRALYKLTNQLTDAYEMHTIASIVAKTLSDYLCAKVGIVCFDENGVPEHTFIQQITPDMQLRREIDDVVRLKYRMEDLRTIYNEGDEFYDWPIYGRENILGIIRIPKESNQLVREKHQEFLHSTIESTALAMDRIRVAEQRIKDRDETTQERYRNMLLRSISHDLRTPLTRIMGTSEMLLDIIAIYEDEQCHTLVESIFDDSKWLYSLVENILSLTRLQEGKLIIGKQMEVVEELISSVVERFSVRSFNREIAVKVPDDPLLVPMDAKLIEQVLINLLDNAYKHTNPEDEISITVESDANAKCAKFIIIDSGTGILEEDLPHIFEVFYTSNRKKSHEKNSFGLGLPICDAIIKAHDGHLTINNRKDSKGVEVIFTLPLEEETGEQ
jgi:two-component system sensor histidine kinase KdpD